MKHKDPLYQLKYVEGFGDLLRVFLHSKFIKPILVLVRGNAEYCMSCSQRAYALNILIPVPLWKFYFKDHDEMKNSFSYDAKMFGYNFDNSNIEDVIEEPPKQKIELGNFDTNQIKYDGFEMMQKSECDYDHIRMVTIIFKRMD